MINVYYRLITPLIVCFSFSFFNADEAQDKQFKLKTNNVSDDAFLNIFQTWYFLFVIFDLLLVLDSLV